jgi:hypothetical protein
VRSILLLSSFALGLLAPRPAGAFCGFFVSGADAKLYNNASQVVLMRKGDRTVLTMSNNYKGPPESFAMVVPVPVILKKEDVKTLPHDVFEHIDQLSAPRLVEYWEQDPCWREPEYEKAEAVPTAMPPPSPAPTSSARLGVKVEAQFKVGEYDIVILSAKEATGLDTWLRQNRYTIPKGAAEALAPYVREQMKFFVAKVDIQKVKRDQNDLIVLSPLRFSYPSQELRLPVRLGLLNAEQKQDLIVFVLHPESRFEVANYKNVFIPTNLEVADEVRKSFGAFYAELFDQTLAKYQGKAIVTEYAWQTTSCDPCPVPPLQASDLATLGNDILSGAPLPSERPQGGPPMPPMPGGGYYGDFSPWVLTRLHTRYDKSSLSEDLIFRQAKPVIGGRANWDGTASEGAGEVRMDASNNFQGRYIIRHYWTGPVKCQSPRYGRWGGPPGGGDATPQAAADLANQPRGKVVLKRVVRSSLPQLDLPGQAPPRRD